MGERGSHGERQGDEPMKNCKFLPEDSDSGS